MTIGSPPISWDVKNYMRNVAITPLPNPPGITGVMLSYDIEQ